MEFKSTYDGVRERVGRSFLVDEDKENEDFVYHRTKQSFKDECDINRLVERYPDVNSEGYMKSIAQQLSDSNLYGEYDSSMDYSRAVEIVSRANEQFETLPSKLRERFGHNPVEFLDYVNDSNNLNEMISMGLAKQEIPPTNIVAPPVQQEAVTPVQPVIQPTEGAVTQ